MATGGAGKLFFFFFFKETTNLEEAKEAQNDSQDLIIAGNESQPGCLNSPAQGYINMKHLIIRETELVHPH